jgi:hypothetical protein
MYDKLLVVIEHLKKLATTRSTSRRQFFNKHIEVIYQDLRPVVDEYRKLFRSLDRDLGDAEAPLERIIDKLRRRRVKFERLRKELWAYANVLREEKKPPVDVSVFIMVVGRLLTAGPTERFVLVRGHFSRSENLLLELEEEFENEGEDARYLCCHLAAKYLARVDLLWAYTVEEYCRLRVKCLK